MESEDKFTKSAYIGSPRPNFPKLRNSLITHFWKNLN